MPKKPIVHRSSCHGEMMSPSSMGSQANPTVLKPERPRPNMSAKDKRYAEPRQNMPDGTPIPMGGKEIHHNRLDTHAATAAVYDFEHAVAEDIFDKFFFTDDITTTAAEAELEVQGSVGGAPTEIIDSFKTTVQNDGYHFLGAAMATLDIGIGEQSKRVTLADAAQAAFVEAHKGHHGQTSGGSRRSTLAVDQTVSLALSRRTSRSSRQSDGGESLRRGTI